MDQIQFKLMTRSLANVPSRRDVLRGIAGTGLGLAALQRLGVAEAGKKNKRKNNKTKGETKSKPLVVNRFGCVDAGQACRGDSNNCCSGICKGEAPRKGKPDRSRCAAHNSSVCKASSDLCSTGAAAICNANEPNRVCTLNTGNAGFCADFSPHIEAGTDASFYCRNCSRDTDCQAEFGAGAACVVYAGICSTYCASTGNRACMPAGD